MSFDKHEWSVYVRFVISFEPQMRIGTPVECAPENWTVIGSQIYTEAKPMCSRCVHYASY